MDSSAGGGTSAGKSRRHRIERVRVGVFTYPTNNVREEECNRRTFKALVIIIFTFTRKILPLAEDEYLIHL